MKEIDVFLKTVVEGMKAMAQGIEALAEKLDTIKTSRVHEKGKAKPARNAPSKPKKTAAKKAAPTGGSHYPRSQRLEGNQRHAGP